MRLNEALEWFFIVLIAVLIADYILKRISNIYFNKEQKAVNYPLEEEEC